MKLVTAIIQEIRLTAVREALNAMNISSITVTPVSGYGRLEEKKSLNSVNMRALLPKIRIDIAVKDSMVDGAVEAIIRASESGFVGDGKIFITPLEDCIRIRTKERGDSAI